jgi:hypothetical protein
MDWMRANVREETVFHNHENARLSIGDADYHVIILRDPYNWAASWWHKRDDPAWRKVALDPKIQRLANRLFDLTVTSNPLTIRGFDV